MSVIIIVGTYISVEARSALQMSSSKHKKYRNNWQIQQTVKHYKHINHIYDATDSTSFKDVQVYWTRYSKTYDVLVESDSFLWKMCVWSEDLNADVVDLCFSWKGSLFQTDGVWYAKVRWL